MYPELFRIGTFPINTYGVLLAMAFLSALIVASQFAARDGLPRERVYDIGLWMLLASLLGSKLLMLITEPQYRENPMQLFSADFLRSGGVFYGGFIGAVLAGFILIKRLGAGWWKTADVFAPGIALGQAIGRLGCFAAGCCWGKPTNMPWGVQFGEAGHDVTGVPIDVHLHPTQIYESIAVFLIFLSLLKIYQRKRFDGQIILAYAILYSIARFAIEFFRDDPRGNVFGLTSITGLSTSQIISVLMGSAALVVLVIKRRSSSMGAVVLPETQASI